MRRTWLGLPDRQPQPGTALPDDGTAAGQSHQLALFRRERLEERRERPEDAEHDQHLTARRGLRAIRFGDRTKRERSTVTAS